MYEPGKFHLLDKYSLKPAGVKGNGFQKILNGYEMFEALFTKTACGNSDLVVFEDYAFAGSGQITRIAELVGMVKLLLTKKKIPFATIPILSAKKAIHGDAKKTTSKLDVQNSLSKYIDSFVGINWNNTDESDAAAVAIAFCLIGMETNG